MIIIHSSENWIITYRNNVMVTVMVIDGDIRKRGDGEEELVSAHQYHL